MNFEDFKNRINAINNHIYEFLVQSEQEEKQNLEQLFPILKENIEAKKASLESLEQELTNRERIHEEAVRKLKEQILQSKPADSLNSDLETKKQELELGKIAELKPYLLTQKKKKNEIIHKITNLKKELAGIHKENNDLLRDEEKDYRAREAELIRRLNIDLERIDASSVKQYIDIEKSLLEINDPKEIEIAKKKINTIRVVGYKEAMTVKNKYALAIFENELEYRKFQENIILNNSIKNEEYRIKVRTQEKEKNILEIAEATTQAMMDLENERKLIAYEKDCKLFAVTSQNERTAVLYQFQEEDQNRQANHFHYRYSVIKEIQNDTFTFDVNQWKGFFSSEEVFTQSLNSQIEELASSMVGIISGYKEQAASLLELSWAKKKNSYQEFKNLLMLYVRDKAASSDFDYKKTAEHIMNAIAEYYRLQDVRLKQIVDFLELMAEAFLNQVGKMVAMFAEYQEDNRKLEKEYQKKVLDILHVEHRYSIENNAFQYTEEMKKINNELFNARKHKNEQEAKSKETIRSILSEYESKIKTLDRKIKEYLKSRKKEEYKEEQLLKETIRNSKARIAELKNNYSSNLIKHEKGLYQKYQEDVQANETERKNKIKALD